MPCSTCDAARYRFEKGDGLGEEKGRMTRLGARIAGILVIEEHDKTFIQAQCGCGASYRTYRATVTGCLRRGKTARCAACISKIRSEAQTVHGRRRRLSRDLDRQQRQREKQGAAA